MHQESAVVAVAGAELLAGHLRHMQPIISSRGAGLASGLYCPAQSGVRRDAHNKRFPISPPPSPRAPASQPIGRAELRTAIRQSRKLRRKTAPAQGPITMSQPSQRSPFKAAQRSNTSTTQYRPQPHQLQQQVSRLRFHLTGAASAVCHAEVPPSDFTRHPHNRRALQPIYISLHQ